MKVGMVPLCFGPFSAPRPLEKGLENRSEAKSTEGKLRSLQNWQPVEQPSCRVVSMVKD